jgi:hypothetical protein
MSQHRIETMKKGKRYRVVYGYDRPLREYFIQAWDLESDGAPLFSVSNRFALEPHPDTPEKFDYSNGELLELYEEWGVPEEHVQLLAMDLPIPDAV